jgi:pimeloyl-ACP methyl ester carboxylesterase
MWKRLLLFAVLGAAVRAQPVKIVGNWLGTLEAGPQKLRMGLHITANDKGELTSSLDSLDQNALGIPIKQTTFTNNKLHLDILAPPAQYDGTLNSDGNEIAGTFAQGGARLPLQFKRVDKIPGRASRPQDPKPPYPYDSEDVSYENKGIHLAGTLTLPRGQGPFPAAVMITGSGPQDRDETILGHKPFWIIADYLARRGIAVLRVDDRGVGKSSGDSTQAAFDDLSGDVLAGVEYLKGRKEIDVKHIGVIGHSEGGMVGPLAATRSSDVAFVVMLAGTGVSFEQAVDSHLSQAELMMREAGAPEEAIARNNALQKTIFRVLRAESDSKIAVEKMRAELDNMKASLPEAQRKALESPGAAAAANQQFASVTVPEMRSILLHDSGRTLHQLKAPVLALNGSRDMQVSAKLNLPAIAAALAEGGNSDFTLVELPGLNHLFQYCTKCTVAEYGELDQTFSPTALLIMGDWLALHTRGQSER